MDPKVGKIPRRRKWQPAPGFLPEKFHGQRNIVGYTPWGLKESWTRLSTQAVGPLDQSVSSVSVTSNSATPWTACSTPGFPVHHQLVELIKLMSIESVMLSNHLILCCPLLSCLQFFLASGSFPMSQFFISGGQSIGASASVLPMKKNWLDLLAVQETVKSLLQHHSSKASILQCSAFFMV